MRRWRTGRAGALRDWLLLIAGLLGTAHETLVAHVDRPWLLGLYATMMGLPYALKADRPGEPPQPPEPQPVPLPTSGPAGVTPSSSSPPASG